MGSPCSRPGACSRPGPCRWRPRAEGVAARAGGGDGIRVTRTGDATRTGRSRPNRPVSGTRPVLGAHPPPLTEDGGIADTDAHPITVAIERRIDPTRTAEATSWMQTARVVRGDVLAIKEREFVLAARSIGAPPVRMILRHILPNVLNPIFVIGTIHLASAIITEATLSFLGVGMSPTTPSLGTLIRIGNEYLLSGEWWITIFPGAALVILVLSVNIFGDWLRDALNPKLR